MIDIVQRALTWLLTWEMVGILTIPLVAVGVPPQVASIAIILILLFAIYVAVGDRYLLDRWKRRFNRWRAS